MKKASIFGDCAMHASMLIKMAERHFGITKERLISSTRKREVIQIRCMCYKIIKKHNNDRFSLADIGSCFGGRDHATVLNGIRAHESFEISDTDDYKLRFGKMEVEYIAKMAGENVEDDGVVKMILAIDRIEEDLALVKRNLIKNYIDSKPIDTLVQKKIESISKLNQNEQAGVLEKNIADGIKIPGC